MRGGGGGGGAREREREKNNIPIVYIYIEREIGRCRPREHSTQMLLVIYSACLVAGTRRANGRGLCPDRWTLHGRVARDQPASRANGQSTLSRGHAGLPASGGHKTGD